MKHCFRSVLIFAIVFLVYFAVGTNYTFKPKWALDYFNPIAQSILDFRLDIVNPGTTYDLSYYEGKWFTPWGVIPALLLIPLQFIKGQFVPTFYLSILFSSLNTVLMYLLLLRIKREFFPISSVGIFVFIALFAFGTTQFYVGTLGSVWHVDQITTSFLGTLGIYIIFRKKREFTHYLISIICFSLAFLGRPTIVLLSVLPLSLYVFDFQRLRKLISINRSKTILLKEVFVLSIPLIFFSSIFFLYNYVRFNNIFEYGFNYIHESSYLAQLREENGAFSIKNIPRNLWYMLFELPGISFSNKNIFSFNVNGNSIFFLTPPILFAFLAAPIRLAAKKFILNPYICSLWLAMLITLIPSLMHYASGWMQLGYRYVLDVNIILVLLSIFGVRGKINAFYILGTVFSILIYILGIRAFM